MSSHPFQLSTPAPVRPQSALLEKKSASNHASTPSDSKVADSARLSLQKLGSRPLLPPGSSLKLLNSHLSIYHALNNPDLDVTSSPSSPVQKQLVNRHPTNPNHPQHLLDKERFPSPHEELSYSLSSWHAISLSSESIQDLVTKHQAPICSKKSAPGVNSPRATSSIISFTSDEDEVLANSLVRVASIKKDTKVMVFDTDEEDGYDDTVNRTSSNDSFDDEDKTLSIDMNARSQNSFIMPRMSISDRLKRFQITILTSNSLQYLGETTQLIKDLVHNSNFSNSDFHITHVMLDAEPELKYHELVLKALDLIFIINDGSDCFVDELTAIFRNMVKEKRQHGNTESLLDEELLPKVTVINMMTVNYFSNLFDIINCLRPCQVWKTSSLKNPSILNKLQLFIREELGGDRFKQEYYKKLIKASSKQVSSSSNSIYLNLVPTEKTNYKLIEKQIKSELQLANIDPLQLSSNFSQVSVLYTVVKKFFQPHNKVTAEYPIIPYTSGGSGGNNLWLLCSFTLGIGLGVTIASGAVTVIGFYLYDRVPSWFFLSPQVEDTQQLNNFLPEYSPSENSVLKRVMTNIDLKLDNFNLFMMEKVVDTSNTVIGSVLNTVSDLVSYDRVSSFFGMFVDQFKSINSVVLDSVRGGCEKLITVAFPSIL